MPLLRRQPFHREKPPSDLRPDEEVFLCKLTREIFRDYEKFFERIILCNSLVWSCVITGRSGLTYQEAEECEEKALKQLASFPAYLQKPILFLTTKTHRSRITDLTDDVFGFAKDRFFIGEVVDCVTGQSKKVCRVIGVIPPGNATPKSPSSKSPNSVPTSPVNGDAEATASCSFGDGSKKSPQKKGQTKPEAFQYMVQEQGKSTTHTLKFKMLSRKKGLFTRDKCKLFLKQSCDNSVDGAWRVKPAKIKKFKLNNVTFDEIYAGPIPKFEFSEIKPKKVASKKPEPKDVSPAGPGKKQGTEPPMSMEELRAHREQERLQREKEKEEKLAQKLKEREEIRRKYEEEKEKRKKEKAMEIEKKREERRIQAEIWREWSRHRDDMECDDLKVLPEPKPVKSRIPVDLFGNAVMVVEFVNCFNSIFDLKASFPKGFSLKTLTEALLETDAGGLMADLLLMMLTAIFSLQEEEEQEEMELSKHDKTEQEALLPDEKMGDMSLKQLIDAATSMSQLPLQTHGSTLRKLPLDNFTLTEILRLHILTSGAQGNLGNAKFRYQQRGGYMPIDDAGLDFKRKEPHVVSRLSIENVYDLSPGDKLKLLTMMVDQFLTYAATRDLLEDNYDKLRQLKNDLKQLQWGEQKREREEATNRYKARMEEKQKERDIMEKRRIIKYKKREELLRTEEATKAGKEVGEEVTVLAAEIEVAEKEVTELEATMPSQEERDEQRQEEDDSEADKKAEYVSSERDFVDNILKLQNGYATQPIGRDRLYRRYWVFRNVQGVFVESDEQFVPAVALEPCAQCPEGSRFDINNPMSVPPKLNITQGKATVAPVEALPQPAPVQGECRDGSDKENDSMNASINNSVIADTSAASANNSLVEPENNTAESVGNTDEQQSSVVKVNGDAIVISDDDDSKPPSLAREEKSAEIVATPAVKQILEASTHRWAFFSSEQEIEALIASLNSRGFRENALKHALVENKCNIIDCLSKVPVDLLYIPDEDEEDMEIDSKTGGKLKTTEWKHRGKSVTYTKQNDSAHEGLELNLREMILDLEERIHVGSLGYLRVGNRNTWREALENGGYDPSCDDPTFRVHSKVKMEVEEGEDDVSKEEENLTIAISKDMAKALVQIARGIEPKYMQPPLGDDEKTKQAKLKADLAKKKGKKKDEDDSDDDDVELVEKLTSQKSLLERWEDSCLVSTSLAQVFLHLSTLEKSVIWSKSILHTRCRICRKKNDPEKILLCDVCDRGHHMYCLKPQLKQVPAGEWFCPDCRPKELKHSPRKGNRRTFSETVSTDDEEEEEEESSAVEEAEDEASTDNEENYTMCSVCSKSTGTLVSCDSCPLFYHLTCAKPPLKKVPKRKWVCQICSGTDTKAGKIKMNLIKAGGNKKKKDSPKINASSSKSTPKTTPNSSRQSSRRGSPRDSPLTVSVGSKKRKRDDSPVVEQRLKMKKGAKSTSKLVHDSKTDEVKHYTSSSRNNSKVLQVKLLEDVVLGLMEEEEAWPFVRPVNKKDAPDYYEIIKKPMDFQTIKNRINKFMYADPAEIVSDVRQIFTNCTEYNKRTTQEFKAGASMAKLFERRIKNLEESAATNGPTSKRARTK